MLRVLIPRIAWSFASLIVISFATFHAFERLPGDRAITAAAEDRGTTADELRRLRIRFGEIDPDTGEERGTTARYLAWLGRAVRFEPAPGTDAVRYRQRTLAALRITFFLGLVTLAVSLAVGIALGFYLGFRVNRRIDRVATNGLLSVNALPEFLLGTLLILTLCGVVGVSWFPPGGLRSPGSSGWSALAQIADLIHHAALPVVTMALGPITAITMLVREAVDRTRRQPFIDAMRNLGTSETQVRRRVLRHSLSPLVTQLGTLVPMLLVGSVVVEQMFALPGLGRMFVESVLTRDAEAATTFTVLSAVLVLGSLLISDLAHRALDPTVRLR